VPRDYVIQDCGEDFQVALLKDGQQVGNCIFDDDGTGSAFVMALEMGKAWVAFHKAFTLHTFSPSPV